MKLTIGNNAELIDKAHVIRNSVFVVEQSIPSQLDLDGLDDESYHALMTKDDHLVGTARLTLKNETHAVLARVSIMPDFRGLGLSTQLVVALIKQAKELNLRMVEIHAHEYLNGYYESLGFHYVKDVEVVGEHQLIEMHLSLC